MLLAHPRRRTDLDIQLADSRYVIHDRVRDYVHVLEPRAAHVLARCDGTHTCDEIAGDLARHTHEPYDDVAREVAHLVCAFADLALLEAAAST
jgi:hypothetical protein